MDVVTANAETLNTVSGELAHVIDTKQVDNLALNGRTYTQLMTLVPGASVTNPDQFAVTTSLSATGQTINGNRSDSANLTVDGAFNLVAGSKGSLMNNVSPDFVQEVKVQTSNFSAEYGRASGPAFNVVTKNGTNQFHGAAFEYLRNDALDARNFFAAQKQPLRFNDFGYDLGGPILKDKLFFFVGEEWKRLRQTATPARVTVPTSAELNGDFTGQKPLFSPGTKIPISSNNVIPANLITPDGRAIANVYNLMSRQGVSFIDSAIPNNLTLAPSNPLNGLIAAGNGVPSSQAARVGVPASQLAAIPTGAPRGFYSGKNTFAPRLSFAYAVDDKTVLRGGYGMFYYRPEGNLIFSQVNIPPFLQLTQYENGNLGAVASGKVVAAPLSDINSINPQIDASYTQQFSFSIQRQLPLSMLLETSYVGNLGRHLLREPDINQPAFSSLVANPAAAENALRPYRGYSAIRDYLSDSTSNYHAFQAYLSKRAGAVVLTAGYTWSKALADSSSFNENDEDYQNRHYNYGPTSYDRRHVFFSTFVWQLPALKGINPVVRSVAGAWQLSGIIRLQSGQYYSITGNTAIGSRRADYVGGAVLAPSGQRGVNNWINPAAFTAASPAAFGTSATGMVEGPGLQTYDLSVAKYFPFEERFNLRFQADFFNAFNVANFSGLGTTGGSIFHIFLSDPTLGPHPRPSAQNAPARTG